MACLGNACCRFLVSPTSVTKNKNVTKYRIFVWFILGKFVFIKFSISNILYSVTQLCSNISIVCRGVSAPLFYFIPPPPLKNHKMTIPQNNTTKQFIWVSHPLSRKCPSPLDVGLFHRCHGCSVISYTCFFFIYVYLLSSCYLTNWSPFNRIKPQAGGNYLHSAIMIKKTSAFFILQVTNVHSPYLNTSPVEFNPPPPPPYLYRKFSSPPPSPLKKKGGGGFTLWLVPPSK